MQQLDLKKNTIENFERTEEPAVSNDMAEQDILRCWNLLKSMYTLGIQCQGCIHGINMVILLKGRTGCFMVMTLIMNVSAPGH